MRQNRRKTTDREKRSPAERRFTDTSEEAQNLESWDGNGTRR